MAVLSINYVIYVTGCKKGHYGDNCLECPSHCVNNTCQMQVGHCFDCEDGYTGPMCEKCNAKQLITHDLNLSTSFLSAIATISY